MRDFVLLSRTSSDRIELNNLSFGRWDVLARSVNSALWVSHGLRPARIQVVLGATSPPKTVTVDPNIKKIDPGERSIAGWIAKVLSGQGENPGITISPASFQTVIKDIAAQGRKFYLLHEKGQDIADVKFDADPVFVLGDHIGLPPKDETFVRRFDHELISVGPRSYLASQCITYLNIELDRRAIP